MNKAILIGNLGQDPDVGQTQTGKLYARLSLATSESWRDKVTGERKERTTWHRVVVAGLGQEVTGGANDKGEDGATAREGLHAGGGAGG